MSEPTSDTLTSRLDRLERELRWWRVAGTGVLCILSVIVLMAATRAQVPDEMKAKRVVIVDQQGNPRIVLGRASDYGKFGLTLLRSKGIAAGEFLTYESDQSVGTALDLYDAKGNPHVHVGMYSGINFDTSNLWLSGNYPPGTDGMIASTERISLEVGSDRWPAHKERGLKPSTASLSLRTGKVGSSLWLDGQSAHLTFHNFEAEPPVAVIPWDKGDLSLGLFDGMPALTLSDGLRGPALGLGHVSPLPPISIRKGSAASLVLFDKDGKVWKAP